MTLGQFQFDGLPYFYKAQRALQSKFYIEAQRKENDAMQQRTKWKKTTNWMILKTSIVQVAV